MLAPLFPVMNLSSLQSLLAAHPTKRLAFQLPDGKLVPPHFHITELGLVTKEFVDCGGVRRSTKACTLQIWVANDVDHVLSATRFGEILSHADKLGLSGDDLVECEYQAGHLSVFQLTEYQLTDVAIVFQLADKNTACLAPDKCGIGAFGNPSGCC